MTNRLYRPFGNESVEQIDLIPEERADVEAQLSDRRVAIEEKTDILIGDGRHFNELTEQEQDAIVAENPEEVAGIALEASPALLEITSRIISSIRKHGVANENIAEMIFRNEHNALLLGAQAKFLRSEDFNSLVAALVPLADSLIDDAQQTSFIDADKLPELSESATEQDVLAALNSGYQKGMSVKEAAKSLPDALPKVASVLSCAQSVLDGLASNDMKDWATTTLADIDNDQVREIVTKSNELVTSVYDTIDLIYDVIKQSSSEVGDDELTTAIDELGESYGAICRFAEMDFASEKAIALEAHALAIYGNEGVGETKVGRFLRTVTAVIGAVMRGLVVGFISVLKRAYEVIVKVTNLAKTVVAKVNIKSTASRLSGARGKVGISIDADGDAYIKIDISGETKYYQATFAALTPSLKPIDENDVPSSTSFTTVDAHDYTKIAEVLSSNEVTKSRLPVMNFYQSQTLAFYKTSANITFGDKLIDWIKTGEANQEKALYDVLKIVMLLCDGTLSVSEFHKPRLSERWTVIRGSKPFESAEEARIFAERVDEATREYEDDEEVSFELGRGKYDFEKVVDSLLIIMEGYYQKISPSSVTSRVNRLIKEAENGESDIQVRAQTAAIVAKAYNRLWMYAIAVSKNSVKIYTKHYRRNESSIIVAAKILNAADKLSAIEDAKFTEVPA